VLTGVEEACSTWVLRFLPLIRPGGSALDLAAGRGRHTKLLIEYGCGVHAVDRNTAALAPLVGPRCTVEQIDLESGGTWPLGNCYDGIIVTNYLHRPLLSAIAGALAPNGVVIYETFAQGNERFGHPRNPDFLLRPGELLEAFSALTIVAFEQGEVAGPRLAVIQRIAAINGPLRRLP
jgi:SAM-dependent methyltransferase